jgi:hypothetical protein
MKNPIQLAAACGIIALTIALARCTDPKKPPVLAQQVLVATTTGNALPQDAMPSCTLTQAQFNAWFASGQATENGAVMPANSVAFQANNNCDFYQWSHQMFLWITSGSAAGTTVMESPVFYTVSPEIDSAGKSFRQLIPHKAGTKLRAGSNIRQFGPNQLPLVATPSGQRVEVLAQKSGTQVKDHKGALLQVQSFTKNADGTHTLLDAAGKPIVGAKAVIPQGMSKIVQELNHGGKTILLDASGAIVESEEGQATGDALLSQDSALVYYITMVNDVYAFYLQGANTGQLNKAKFPTTAAERDAICKLARANGVTLPDSNALAMELKTSWVETTKLAHPENYVTIEAIVPTYTKTNQQWIPKGEKTTKLALVGAHIVGSVAGHPEMVWATFEHTRNTPNPAYPYLAANGSVKTVLADTGGGWLFSNNAADATPNVSNIKVKGDMLVAAATTPGIVPSNTLRIKPWGVSPGVVPNQQDTSASASNSEIISINNAIIKMLPGNDVRKNYYLIGAIWTFGGNPPDGNVYDPSDKNSTIGTSRLANSTMETYFQQGKFMETTCFTCHSGAQPSVAPADLSHVFSAIRVPIPH